MWHTFHPPDEGYRKYIMINLHQCDEAQHNFGRRVSIVSCTQEWSDPAQTTESPVGLWTPPKPSCQLVMPADGPIRGRLLPSRRFCVHCALIFDVSIALIRSFTPGTSLKGTPHPTAQHTSFSSHLAAYVSSLLLLPCLTRTWQKSTRVLWKRKETNCDIRFCPREVNCDIGTGIINRVIGSTPVERLSDNDTVPLRRVPIYGAMLPTDSVKYHTSSRIRLS